MSDTNTNTKAVAGTPPYFKDVVILRVKDAIAKPSRGGNPMIELKLEIVKPETYLSPFDGKNYALDSAELMSWLLLWELDKSGNPLQNGLSWLNSTLMPMLGLGELNPAAPLFDAEKNPTGVKLKGVCFEAIVETKERIEQRRLPNGTYEPLKDMQGNIIKRGWQWESVNADAILRHAEVETNKMF